MSCIDLHPKDLVNLIGVAPLQFTHYCMIFVNASEDQKVVMEH